MSSSLVKRSIRLSGHLTSIAMEAEFWEALEKIADSRTRTVSSLINEIDLAQEKAGILAETQGKATITAPRNLTSALRVFVLKEVQKGAYGG